MDGTWDRSSIFCLDSKISNNIQKTPLFTPNLLVFYCLFCINMWYNVGVGKEAFV